MPIEEIVESEDTVSLLVDDQLAYFTTRTEEYLLELRKRDAERLDNLQRYRQQMSNLWGIEPVYEDQIEDRSGWLSGALLYSWVGHFMHQAAKGELSSEKLPRQTRPYRSYNSGKAILDALEQQWARLHQWDTFIGLPVTVNDGRYACGGVLRWVGQVQQFGQPGTIYAGVEWRQEPTCRQSCWERCNRTKPVWHNGTVYGEHLFTTSTGEETATCEDARHIQMLLTDGMDELNPGLRSLLKRREKEVPISAQQAPQGLSVVKAMVSALGHHILLLGPIRMIRDTCILFSPILLQKYISFVERKGEGHQWWYGGSLVFGMFLLTLTQSLANNKYSHLSNRCSYMFSSGLTALLFAKCLTISDKALALPEMNSGHVISMMSTDVRRAQHFVFFIWSFIFSPVQLLVSLYLLYSLVGWPAFVGLGVLVVFSPLQGVLMKLMFANYRAKALATDARIKATNELLSGVRVAKLMAWEPMFIINIEEKRRHEIAVLRRIQLLSGLSSFVSNAIPGVMVASVFLCYTLQGNVLSPHIIFPALALLSGMQTPFSVLPWMTQGLMQFVVSMRRLTRFLECEDCKEQVMSLLCEQELHHAQAKEDDEIYAPVAAHFDNACIGCYTAERLPVLEGCKKEGREYRNEDSTIPQGNAGASSWGSGENDQGSYDLRPKELLPNVSARFPHGGLTVIIGPTGSGKSTLLNSILGAAEVMHGVVAANPSTAYVPQQPWIMNATLRENILFFRDYDAKRFNVTLSCTCLLEDVTLLVGGVEAEIGENGINLSGGQKARVSLARALYADQDLYLLDDPLSALDAHTGARVMQEYVMGALANKTRVLATHQVHLATQADYVLLLQTGGQVAFAGSTDEYRAYIARLPFGGPSLFTWKCVDGETDDPLAIAGGVQSGNNSSLMSHTDASRTVKEDSACATSNDPHTANLPSSRLMTEEETAVGGVPTATYLRYMQACGGVMSVIVVVTLFVITEFCMMAPSLCLSFWSADSLGFTQQQYLKIYLLLSGISTLCSPLRYWLTVSYMRRACRSLHSQLLRSMCTARLCFFDTTPLGRLMNRFSRDMNQLDSELGGDILYCCIAAFSVLSTLTVMVVSQYMVLMMIVPCVLIYYKLMVFYNAASREIRRVTNIANSPIFSILGETLCGRWTIKAYGKSSFVMRETYRRLDTMSACVYMEIIGERWLSVRLELVSNAIITSMAMLGVLSVQLQWFHLNVGLLSLSVTMAMRISSLLNNFIGCVSAVEAGINSVERIIHYIDTVPREEGLSEIEEAVQSQREGFHNSRKRGNPGGSPCTHGTPQENIRLLLSDAIDNSVSTDASAERIDSTTHSSASVALELCYINMRYREGLPLVLKDVSATIRCREKVGVVGRTGSGKSSLLLAILRLVEIASGEVRICGHSSSAYSLRSLRQLFSMIPQDPLLFSGTVRFNVDPLGAASDNEIWKALQLVGVDSRVREEVGGIDSTVQEGGSNYSVGQRQLLCMARALLKPGASFLLMDEATANIDPAHDQQIQHTVHHAFQDYTVITIAHRLTTLARYDTIMVMDNGHLIEHGSPRHLLSRKGSAFWQLVHAMDEKGITQFYAEVEQREPHMLSSEE